MEWAAISNELVSKEERRAASPSDMTISPLFLSLCTPCAPWFQPIFFSFYGFLIRVICEIRGSIVSSFSSSFSIRAIRSTSWFVIQLLKMRRLPGSSIFSLSLLPIECPHLVAGDNVDRLLALHRASNAPVN